MGLTAEPTSLQGGAGNGPPSRDTCARRRTPGTPPPPRCTHHTHTHTAHCVCEAAPVDGGCGRRVPESSVN